MNDKKVAISLLKMAKEILSKSNFSPIVEQSQLDFPSHHGIEKVEKLYEYLNGYYPNLVRERSHLSDQYLDMIKTFISVVSKLKRSEESLYYKASENEIYKYKTSEVDMSSVMKKAEMDLRTYQKKFEEYLKKIKREKDPVLRRTYKKLSEAMDLYDELIDKIIDLEIEFKM